jgi:hypothetical protein
LVILWSLGISSWVIGGSFVIAAEGALADKTTQLVLDALSRAVTDPGGVPLFGGKAAPGLLVASTAAKQAAQLCKDEGYLRVVRTETKGKTVQEICAITEKGLAYLLSQVSPRHVLEEFVRALESRQAEVGDLVAAAQQTRASFDALKATAEKVLQQLGQPSSPAVDAVFSNGADTWVVGALSYLAQRQTAAAMEDCPLPELYQHARQTWSALTIGQFHDGLRRLYQQEAIYLHPWTGPLYDIPEPALALLVGHEIAYYASRR